LEEGVEITKMREIRGLKLVTQEFEPLDVDRMIKTASELIKKDSAMVVVFYGKDQKTARIVVMAGKEATKKGIDAGEIANEAASVLGGGGSGRLDFAQGGGTQTRRVSEALRKAEETIKKQLESKK
jgi:alanyl-tRNA synthetase